VTETILQGLKHYGKGFSHSPYKSIRWQEKPGNNWEYLLSYENYLLLAAYWLDDITLTTNYTKCSYS